MKNQILKIKDIENVTHNVLRFSLEDSNEIDFVPGQAAEIAADKDGWRDKGQPFTFTSLPSEDHLEFTIKIYPKHEGVTEELSKLSPGDNFILRDVFGAIKFKGKGTFIAGGAGVTPFISILRNLHDKGELPGNRLIFANSKERDIINEKEFEKMLGDDFINILSKEDIEPYSYGHIDKEYLKENITSLDDYFYVCGPEAMMDVTIDALKELGVKDEKIVKEKFN